MLTAAWVSGGMLALLALPGLDAPDAPLLLGLPRRAAFLLLGLGLLPGLVIPLAYGVVFDRQTLTEEDLSRLRETAARVRREMAGEAEP